MHIRKRPGTLDELREYSGLVIDNPTALRGNWSSHFGRELPLFVEVGCGKGGFIAEMAAQNPGMNYVGVERIADVLIHAVRKVGPKSGNIRFILDDADQLSSFFAPGEISGIYLNFSDPWPKKRHEKRRLTHTRYLQVYKSLLKKGGTLHLKTDDRSFFEFSLQSFIENGFSVSRITYDLHAHYRQDNVLTEYERKFSSLGLPICRLEAYAPSAGEKWPE